MRNKITALACAIANASLALQLGSLVWSPAAMAQEPAEESGNSNNKQLVEEVIVTGTQMSGVMPTGAELISITSDSVAASGATNTAQLLSTIPQIAGFGDAPAVSGSQNVQLTVNRISLRNLPQGIGAASPTLILMDGHRLVGVGVGQNYPDPDVVPPGVIERVEILTDGGSSVYGADAIGGVVNFITKKSIEGVEISARGGLGDDYTNSDTYVSAGDTWGDTSAYVSFNHSRNEEIYGKDRDYVKRINWNTGEPVDLTCDPANARINNKIYAVQNGNTLVPGTQNLCDTTQDTTIYPEGERNSVFGGLTHDLNESVQFGLKTWYTDRENVSDEGPLKGTAVVRSSSPLYISSGDQNASANQSVGFNFAPVDGMSNDQTTTMEQWGISPSVDLDLTDQWSLRAYYNYGYSDTEFDQQEVNNVAINEGVAAGTLNPYNIAASDPAAIALALDRYQRGRGKDELHNLKAVFDGVLFNLPGGELRTAIGAEYLDESYEGKTQTDVASAWNTQPYTDANRDVKAYFAELNIPIVGETNSITGIAELTFGASYRHDDYSDFGTADSPNYAIDYRPVEWLRLRGRWNEAFQAPGLSDLANANTMVDTYVPVPGIVVFPDYPAAPSEYLIAAQGTKLPLDPQEADNFNIGFDLDVPFVENLRISVSYYEIDYQGQISIPPTYRPAEFFQYYPESWVLRPTAEEATAYMNSINIDQDEIDNALAEVGDNPIYAVYDARRTNLGLNKFQGYDFVVNYVRDVSWGELFVNLNTTYTDSATSQVTPAAPKVENAGINSPDFIGTLTVGTRIGDRWTVQAKIFHRAEYDTATPDQLGIDKIDEWNTYDAYAQYDFPGTDWTENLSVSLGINNMFDEDPPTYHGTWIGNTEGYAGSTLGRVVNLGFTKAFR